MLHRRRTLATLILAIAVITSSCSSAGSGGSGGPTTTGGVEGDVEGRGGGGEGGSAGDLAHPQSLWTFEQVVALDLDADDADAVDDLTEAILDEIGSDTEADVELADDVTFEPVDALEPELLDRDGAVRGDVTLLGGVLTTPDGRSLAVLGTPDGDASGPVALDDVLRVDLTFLEGRLSPGQPLRVDLARTFAHASGDDPAEANLTGLDLFRHRVDEGRISYLGESTDDGPLMHVTSDVLGMAVAGSIKAEVPAGAEGLFDGMGEGLRGCRFGLKCVKNYFDKTAEGFAKSMDYISCMLTPGCGNRDERRDRDRNDERRERDRNDERRDRTDRRRDRRTSKLRGDPHVQTFDGTYYGMHAVGEFIGAIGDDVEVQVRTAPLEGNDHVSILTAVAVGVGEHRIVVADDTVTVDGEIDEQARTSEGVDLDGVGVWFEGGAVVIAADDGPAITVQRQWGDSHDLWIELDPEDDATWTGLMGDTDGDPENDFRTRDGEVLEAPLDFETMYETFAESWRIDDDESLFDYADGEDTETFTDRSFPEAPFSIDSIPAAERLRVERLCRMAGIEDETALTECVIDFFLTGEITSVRAARVSDTIEAIRTGRIESDPDDGSGSEPIDVSGEPVVLEWATTARDIREADEENSRFRCPEHGMLATVWGTDEYSDDSSICSAAVHVGMITIEEGGEVLIEHTPGRDSYEASDRNGVSTRSWNDWPGSFVFIGATGRPVTGEQP